MPNEKLGNLRLIWLEAFIAVAETKSYTMAGKRFRTGQSNMSRYVENLEKWLHKVLVSPVTPTLTDDGKAFLPVAKNVVQMLKANRAILPPPDKDV